MVKRSISDFKRSNAKRLRSGATHAEKLLWQKLRHLEISGSHFRRQVVIGPYVADFACLAARLIVEVDGSQHGEAHSTKHDLKRTRWLGNEGYRVLRFWNNEVVAQPDAVMEAIFAALILTPPRPQDAGDPPPQWEGEVPRGKTIPDA